MSTSSGGGSTALSMDKDAFGERVQALLELRDEINENGECEVKVKESTSPSIDEYKKQYGELQGMMSKFCFNLSNLGKALNSAKEQMEIIDEGLDG